jgi:hypothetical protein
MARQKCVEAVPDRPGNSLLGGECHSNKSISDHYYLQRQRTETRSAPAAFHYPRFVPGLESDAWVLDCSGGRLALDSLRDLEGM